VESGSYIATISRCYGYYMWCSGQAVSFKLTVTVMPISHRRHGHVSCLVGVGGVN